MGITAIAVLGRFWYSSIKDRILKIGCVMKIDFPKEEDNLPPKDAFTAYSHLIDLHLYFLKQQSSCEFFYWKAAGIFFLATIGSFILQDLGIIPSALVGVLIVGVGCLLIFTQKIRTDFEYGIKAATCVEKGLRIEKNHDYPKLFGIFEDNKSIVYRGNLLSRLFPSGLIALATSGAATFLAMKIGTWLAVIVAAFSITALYLAARSYIKTVRKILLKD